MWLRNFYLVLATTILVFPLSSLHAEENPELCNQLFGLPEGTIQMEADKRIMNPEVCAAYQFLISRYNPGPRSSVGLSNPKIEGIIKLNPDFAVAVAKMLQNAPYMVINSAYRTPEGQGSKNPQSNHIYGCAVDLGYSQSSCSQATCQWVLRNSGAYGLHIRMKYNPEWNHVEPIAKDACRSGGPGVGAPVARTPSSELIDRLRQTFGSETAQQSEQNCTLPDGLVVPCSAIANRTGPVGSSGQTGVPGGGISPAQTLPAASQPFQYFPAAKPVSNIILPQTGQSATSSATNTLSAFERLRIIAQSGSASSTSTSTSTPFVLIVRREDAVGIQDTGEPRVFPIPNSSYQLLPVNQSTFTSAGFGEIHPAFAQEQSTGLQKTLADMRSTLLYILEYLRPFGRPIHAEHPGEYSDWSE